MRFATSEAFRAALDQRLKNHADETGSGLTRLRKAVAFDRFLARLVAVAPDRWVLKGALALDLRLGGAARTTKDIDLGRSDNEQAATEDLFAASAMNLGDFFSFTVRRTSALDKLAGFSAVRYRVRCELAGREFEQFPVDVGFSDQSAVSAEQLEGTDLLAFADIERTQLPVLPLEQHIAEKLHAYARDYGTDATPSSRSKDLVDIVLIKQASTLDADKLRTALESTFAKQGSQLLPPMLPQPPRSWATSYAQQAGDIGLLSDLQDGFSQAATLLNPVLAGRATGQWDPTIGAWTDGR